MCQYDDIDLMGGAVRRVIDHAVPHLFSHLNVGRSNAQRLPSARQATARFEILEHRTLEPPGIRLPGRLPSAAVTLVSSNP